MGNRFHEMMFTESVKDAQELYGSRRHYARLESREKKFEGLGDLEKEFVETRDGFYIATVNEDRQPYLQFRGGPPGFLKVLDDKTLGYADFRGNLQYISVGNLAANNKAALFLMDYAHQRRLKILCRVDTWSAADAPDQIEKLRSPDYKAKAERAMILHVEAFDWNCPQHIRPKYTAAEIAAMLAPINEYIKKLEAEIFDLRNGINFQE